jgi:hypothetical protein
VAEMKGGEKVEGSGLRELGKWKDIRGCIACSVVPYKLFSMLCNTREYRARVDGI